MHIQFSEQLVGTFIIPAFTLSAGEIVVIKFPEGQPFFDMVSAMNRLLTRETISKNIIVTTPVRYAGHLKYSTFFQLFFPMTVGKWLNKYANKSNHVYEDIFKEIEWLKPNTKVDSLAGTYRRLLSIYTALSWTNNIALDFAGVDPEGGKRIYTLMKKITGNGGSIILYDRYDEFKDDCTLFVKARVLH